MQTASDVPVKSKDGDNQILELPARNSSAGKLDTDLKRNGNSGILVHEKNGIRVAEK